jgi:hypothetical protein
VFVSLNAVVEPAHKAVVTSGLQLSIPLGMLLGVTAGSAAMLQVVQNVLDKKLLEAGLDLAHRTEVITSLKFLDRDVDSNGFKDHREIDSKCQLYLAFADITKRRRH